MVRHAGAFALFVAAGLAGCTTQAAPAPNGGVVTRQGDAIVIRGALDVEVFRTLEALFSEAPATRIIVTSEGGSAWSAANIALFVQKHSLSVRLEGYCLSSCAEYIFPSTRDLVVARDAVIGFHGNPLLERSLLQSVRGETAKFCGEPAARALSFVYEKPAADVGFWEREAAVLKPDNIRVVEGDGCSAVEYDAAVDTWLPLRSDLEVLLNRPIVEPLCVDDPACVRRRLAELFPKGRRVAIGAALEVVE